MRSKVWQVIIQKVLKVRLWLLIVLVAISVLFYLCWLKRSGDSRLAWALRYPSKKLELSVCSLISPTGWDIIVNRKHNMVDSRKLIFMSANLFESEDKFPESEFPYISLFFRNHSSETFWIHNAIMGRFLLNVGAKRTIHDIDGKNVVVYRYEGPRFFYVVDSGNYKIEEVPECNSVSIGVCSDFGFYGVFWGLPENERDFWAVMKSIQWDEQKE